MFEFNTMIKQPSIKIAGCMLEKHKCTISYNKMLIIGSKGKVIFVDKRNQVCLAEMLCNGRVISMVLSSSKTEIDVYTETGHFYRIWIDAVQEIRRKMHKIHNSENAICLTQRYEPINT